VRGPTPDGSELRFTLSGFVENTANLMSSDAYGIFLTTEKLYAISVSYLSEWRSKFLCRIPWIHATMCVAMPGGGRYRRERLERPESEAKTEAV